MTQDELAQLRARAKQLFRGGDDDDEITRLWMREARNFDFERAMAALNQYAVMDGGPTRRFIPGKFMRAYEAQPAGKPTVVLVDRERHQREFDLKAARDAAQFAAIREERERDRLTVLRANPLEVGEVVDQLILWGAPRPSAQPESWPMPWYMAVADILLDRVRAAPTEAGYYEQVMDEAGRWVDDPTRPLNPLPAREWWRAYGAAGLDARGMMPVSEVALR